MSQFLRGKDLSSKLSNGSKERGFESRSASNSETKFSRRALHSSWPRFMPSDPAAPASALVGGANDSTAEPWNEIEAASSKLARASRSIRRYCLVMALDNPAVAATTGQRFMLGAVHLGSGHKLQRRHFRERSWQRRASRGYGQFASTLPASQRTWKTSLPRKWRDSLRRWASAASDNR